MKLTVIIGLICSIALYGFDTNPTLANLPDTTWHVLADGWSHVPWNTTAYSGGIYDYHRHKILAFGGGHATDGSNQVSELDINTGTWTALYDATPCDRYVPAYCVYDSKGTPCGGIFEADGDTMASTRHTYDGIFMAYDTCLMVVCNGPFGGSGGSYCPQDNSHNDWCGNAYWFFDPINIKWTHTIGGLGLGPGSPVAQNPTTGLVYSCRAGNALFRQVNYKNGTYTDLSQWDSPNWEGYRAMEYYGPNNSCLFFGEDNVWEWEIDHPEKSWVLKNPAGTHADAYNHRVSYDSTNNVFCIFRNGAFRYYSYKDNRWYGIPYATTYPSNPQFHNSWYDPVNNIHILIGSDRKTWAYKFSNTPGEFPGTSAGTTPVTKTVQSVPAVQVSVMPNPVNKIASIKANNLEFSRGIHLDFYDLGGRLIDRIHTDPARLRSGVSWSTADLSNGVYLLQIRAGADILTKKILIHK